MGGARDRRTNRYGVCTDVNSALVCRFTGRSMVLLSPTVRSSLVTGRTRSWGQAAVISFLCRLAGLSLGDKVRSSVRRRLTE